MKAFFQLFLTNGHMIWSHDFKGHVIPPIKGQGFYNRIFSTVLLAAAIYAEAE